MLEWLGFDPDLDPAIYGQGPLLPFSVPRWMPTDTRDLFEKNLHDPARAPILVANGWTSDSIRYRANDHGFRMDLQMSEITPGECDFYLGCSITFGTGLNIEDTWAHKLSQRNGVPMVNLAHPGTGLETQHRMLMSWAERLKPRRAYTLGANPLRREVMVTNKPSMRMGPWTKGRELDLYRHLSDETEARLGFLRAADAMKHICQQNGIELMVAPQGDPWLSPSPELASHTARDLMHWGKDWHDHIAERPHDWWQRVA